MCPSGRKRCTETCYENRSQVGVVPPGPAFEPKTKTTQTHEIMQIQVFLISTKCSLEFAFCLGVLDVVCIFHVVFCSEHICVASLVVIMLCVLWCFAGDAETTPKITQFHIGTPSIPHIARFVKKPKL